jgi:hypothetical protein
MSIDQTTRRPGLTAALLIALTAAAPAAINAAPAVAPGAPSGRVARFLGPRAAAILARASRVEIFRVQDKRAGEGDKSVGGYVIAAAGTEQADLSARRLADLLLDEKSYRFDHSTVGGFVPLVGLRLWDGERSVDVLVSFATDEVVVFSRNPDDGSVRSAQADAAPARGALVALAKQALPDDRAVRALQSSAVSDSSTRSPSTGTVPR